MFTFNKDDLFVFHLDANLADCPNNYDSMRRLLGRIVGIKNRAITNQDFDRAAKLHKAERKLKSRIRTLLDSAE